MYPHRPLVLLSLLAACTPDSGLTKYNNEPEPTITSPVDGAEFWEGDEVTFTGVVSDANHGPDELTAGWGTSTEILCEEAPLDADGQSTCVATLTLDATEINFVARDVEGATGATAISLHILGTEAPTAEILSPVAGGEYYADVPIAISALVSDAEDGPDALTVSWTDGDAIDLDDTIDGDGALEDLVTFAPGDHKLALLVVDSDGKTTETSVEFTVQGDNHAPTCEITAPLPGDTFELGASIAFKGVVSDPDVEPQTLSVAWASDLDGNLGGGSPDSDGATSLETSALSFGNHTISLTATDAAGATCVAAIGVVVGAPPEVNIDAPVDGDLFNEGAAIDFLGSAADSGTDPLDLLIEWTSDLDGLIDDTAPDALGALSFGHAGLSPGDHTITLRATDRDGLWAEDTVAISVNDLPSAPVISLDPASPNTDDALVATILTASADLEGDPITYTYAWWVDGAPTAYTGDTIPASDTTRGQTWTVVITPNDGLGDGDLGTASVTVQNSAPVLASVTLGPDPAYAGDTLTCAAGSISDLDGDSTTAQYAWTVNGLLVTPTTSQLGSSWFDAGDTVSCTVTPNDGLIDGAAITSNVLTIENSAPSITSAAITPDPATATDTLSCAAAGFSDADGDPDLTTYAWTVNGAAAGTGSTLAGAFVGGDVVVCTATPYDGHTTGVAHSDSLTISNTPPVLASATLSPSSATETDTLACTPGVVTDDDGTTAISYSYSWTIGGAVISATTSTLTGTTFDRGDVVRCRITPNDGTEDGAMVASNNVTIGNAAPTLSAVSISPTTAYTATTLTASITGSDPDGDTVSATYAWYVDGSLVSGVTGATLTGSYFSKGQSVYVVATPTDGTTMGTALASSAVTISNTAPSITSASIAPSSATVGTTLTCSTAGYSDADGDAEATTYTWKVGSTTIGTGATLSSGYVAGDTVVCTATPFDGTTTGTAKTASITIANAAPVLASVSLTPTTAYEASTLTCTPGSTTDADGTTSFTYTYAWYVNGSVVTPTTATLTGTYFAKGQTVYCKATPSDGTTSGSAVSSNTVTISNTAPVASAVAITPATAYTNDTLTATVSASDADSDTLSTTYTWYVNGSAVSGVTGSTLAGTYFSKGQSVTVTALVSDGTTSSSVSSSALTISNTAPSISAASISPSTATVGTTLTCSTTGYADADGDAEATTYTWKVGSTTIGTGATLSSGYVAGDTVVCTATPSDGTTTGTAKTASITIANTAPVLASVSLTPTTAYEASTLTCTPGSTTDADGTTSFTYTYAWYVNGSVIAPTTSTLTGTYFAKGQTVYCKATPSDGTTSGSAVSSNTVTISNTAPAVASVTLTPSTAYTNDTLTATVSASDADSDTLSTTYTWYVNGSAVSGVTGSTLAGTYFSKGQSITVTALVSDGTTSASLASSALTISNTAPSISSASISPSSATVGTTLTCSTAGYSDADGDAEATTYTWKVGSTTIGTSATLSSGYAAGDTIVCTATPSDGTTTGTAKTASITIANSAPVLASVSLTPTTAYETSTLTCTPGSTTDADGTTSFTYTYAWYVNGSVITPTTSTLTGTYFAKGQTVYCKATPSDGTTSGSAVSSNTVTISNTAPAVASVTITPATAYTNDTLTATVSSSDADGDTLSTTYTWYVNGSAVSGVTGSTLAGTYFSKGQSVTVAALVSDGTTSTSLTSSARTISNTGPTVTGVSISPTTAYAGNTLTCATIGYSDADGDAEATTYVWKVGSTTIGTSATVSTGFTSGNVVTCTATPSDGTTTGTAVSTSVTISNTAPVVGTVTLTPTTAYEASTFTCTPSAVTDADGTTSFTYTYTWYVNSAALSVTTSTLSGTYFNKGNTVQCKVAASDGTSTGTATSSNTVTVSNTAPVISSVSLSPSTVYTNDTLTASVSGSDADSDTVSYTYTWYVNGSAIAPTTSTLSGATYFSKGQTVYVRATPTDGTTSGTAMSSSTITVSNSGPSTPAVTVTPSAPQEGLDDVVCGLSTASSDADGDTLTYTFNWKLNGSVWSGATATTTRTGDTIDAAYTAAGDVWSCTVTASDGSASATSAASSATVTTPVTITYYGYPTQFSSNSTVASGYIFAESVTLPAGTLWEMGYIAQSTNTATMVAALYTNSGGAPGTLVAQTAPFTPTADTAVAVLTAPVTITAGTYWMVWLNSNTLRGYYTTAGACASTPTLYKAYTYTTTMPTTYPTGSSSTPQCNNIYVGVD